MRKYFTLLFLAFSLLAFSQEKEPVIRLNIEGKDYEQLTLVYNKLDGQTGTVAGVKLNQKTWLFPVNDSIINNVSYYSFRYAPTNKKDGRSFAGTTYYLSINAVNQNDTISTFQLPMDRDMMEYDITYQNHTQYESMIDEHLLRIYELENFLTPYKANTEYAIKADCSNFLTFYNGETRKRIDYAEGMDLYRKQIEKYPDSQYLISSLNSNSRKVKRKEDMQSLLSVFSEEQQQSPFGKSIRQYMDTHMSAVKFENTTLPKWDTEEPEEILQDKTKNTLIVFSASWCGPCRAQIPLLKEIYADLKDKLNIVYVSMDGRKTVDGWRKEMTEKEIPWRSVLATDQLKEIEKKYFVKGIPHTLLYRADAATVEVFDVRKEENKAKLYELSK